VTIYLAVLTQYRNAMDLRNCYSNIALHVCGCGRATKMWFVKLSFKVGLTR